MSRPILAAMATLLALPVPGLAAKHPERITPRALARALKVEPERYVVVDVRSPAEWNGRGGHIDGAVSVPWPGIKEVAAEAIDARADQTVVLVCFTGHRSQWAMEAVRDATDATVVDLKGGMVAWWARDLPVVEEPGAPTGD